MLGILPVWANPSQQVDWAQQVAKVLKDPTKMQSVFLYPAPKVVDAKTYRKEFKEWLKYEKNYKRDGVSLHGWFYERKGKPLLVYYGANNEDVSYQLWWLQKQKDYAFLVVNYRGYALSTGVPEEKAIVADALFVLDKVLKETKRTSRQVVLVGRSLGTGVAVQVAAQRAVSKVVLITPFDSVEALAKRFFWILPVSEYLSDTWNSLSVASKVKAKVALIVGGKDLLIPAEHSERLKVAFPHMVGYVSIPEATHVDITQCREFEAIFQQALDV